MRWVLLVLIGMAIGGGAGYIAGSGPPRSVSSSQLLVVAALAPDPSCEGVLTGNQYVNQRMPTYAVVASSDVTTYSAAAALDVAPDVLRSAVSASAVPETTVLTLQVTGPTPQDAQKRNAAVVKALQTVIEETENVPRDRPRVRPTVVSPPSLPESRPSLVPVTMAVGAMGGGLAVAVGGWLLVSWRRRAAQSRTALDDPMTAEAASDDPMTQTLVGARPPSAAGVAVGAEPKGHAGQQPVSRADTAENQPRPRRASSVGSSQEAADIPRTGRPSRAVPVGQEAEAASEAAVDGRVGVPDHNPS